MVNGRRLIGFGLSRENCIRLLAGQPITFNLGEIDPALADCDVWILGGETEADLRGLVMPLVGPETVERFPG